jgi:transcriptional regulator with XRE-family HTH domain
MNAIARRVSYGAVVGAIVAEERATKKLSQENAANKAEIPQSTWARVELGRACTLDNIAKIANVLQVAPWELIRAADDRVKSLAKQGITVVNDTPSEDEVRANPYIWLTGSAAISRESLMGLGAVAGATAIGVAAYISKLFGDKKP